MANTTADKLNLLKQTKADIKTALANKGQTVDDTTPFSDYAEKINNIEGIEEYFPLEYPSTTRKFYGSNDTNSLISRLKKCPPINIPNGADLLELFKNCCSLVSIPQINTIDCIKTFGMFENCVDLISVPEIDMSEVIDCSKMYSYCESLTTVPQSNLIIPKATYITAMFEYSGITSINLTANACNIASNLCYYCQDLITAILSLKYVQNLDSCFYGCTSLTTVDLTDSFSYNRVPTEPSNIEFYTSMDSCFIRCTSLTTVSCDSNVIYGNNYNRCFSNCTKLTTIPSLSVKYSSGDDFLASTFNSCTSLTTVTFLNMSDANSSNLSMSKCFSGCTSLTTISGLDLSKVSSLDRCFSGCTSLTNDFLNTLLGQLVNVSSNYIGTKTLKYIGLSETQATTCTTLSNWSTAEAAGWTTGY